MPNISQPEYIELHAHSAYAFLEGSARPARYVQRAKELGYGGIALLDRDGMYGAVQTNRAGSEAGFSLIQGCEVSFSGFRLPVLAANPSGYRQLCATLSEHNLKERNKPWNITQLEAANADAFLAGDAASYLRDGVAGQNLKPLQLEEFAAAHQGDWFVLSGGHYIDQQLDMRQHLKRLKTLFGSDHVAVEASLNGAYDDQKRLDRLGELAQEMGLPLVATSGAIAPESKDLPVAQALHALAGKEQIDHAWAKIGACPPLLLSRRKLAQIYASHPQALTNATRIGRQCAFDLRLIAPRLPRLDASKDEDAWLSELAYQGAARRYGSREHNPRAWKQIDHELEIIKASGFAGYFLIVYDIVEFCRQNDILAQGRGSAANSAVCYCLGITAVDAVKHKMLFERFLTPDRKEYPDIDIDIEAKRRELVIQYVYQRYGRENAAQVANVIEYKPRSAITDAARALGHDAASAQGWMRAAAGGKHSEYLAAESIPKDVRYLASNLVGLPRHLGLHSGGMIVSDQPISHLCVLQNATMAERTMVQWDKEDCADVGLVKIDLLGLGMLTALRLAFTWMQTDGIQNEQGESYALHNLGDDDPLVYDLLCRADTVGVFQVESRAQMATLPRLKPRCFYDIVVEVALIRPGPIQGRAVNPFIRRRNGLEPVTYLHPLLEPALKKTLGVPLFQEQLMRIATDVGGFDAVQADRLRRAVSAKHSRAEMEKLRAPLYQGMSQRGISGAQADAIWEQLLGFAKFGFPESHSFSFAYIVYASAWLKVHYPAYFYAALIAAQPMGFYSVQALIEDGKRHGVRFIRPCINNSQASTTVAHDENGIYVQLGLNRINSWSEKECETVAEQAKISPFESVEDLLERTRIRKSSLEQAAQSGALRTLKLGRRQALWHAGNQHPSPLHQRDQTSWRQLQLPIAAPAPPPLPALSERGEILADIKSLGASIDVYPTELVRQQWRRAGYLTSAQVADYAQRRIWVAGIVTHRQRPGTAHGFVFLTLCDELGSVNIICSRHIWQRYRRVGASSPALAVRGMVQCESGVTNVIADKLVAVNVPYSGRSRDFR